MSIADNIRCFFAQHESLKYFFKPAYDLLVKKRQFKKLNKAFLDNALGVLSTFDKCMTDAGVHYMLAYGTLLGAIRDKGFIKYDVDMDVMVWSDEYGTALKSALNKAGFKLIHQFLIEEGCLGREETYKLHSTTIDIFYIFPPVNDYPYMCQFTAYPPCPTFDMSMKELGKVLAHRVEIPVERERIFVPFETLSLPVPHNYKQVLSYIYGDDYMIPNPNWSMGQYHTHIVDWYDAKAVYMVF